MEFVRQGIEVNSTSNRSRWLGQPIKSLENKKFYWLGDRQTFCVRAQVEAGLK